MYIPKWIYKTMVETGMNKSCCERKSRLEDLTEDSEIDPALELASPGYEHKFKVHKDY